MLRYLNHPQTIKFLSNCDKPSAKKKRIRGYNLLRERAKPLRYVRMRSKLLFFWFEFSIAECEKKRIQIRVIGSGK